MILVLLFSSQGITIKSADILDRAKKTNYPVTQENGQSVLQSPDGYKFFVVSEQVPGGKECGMTTSSLLSRSRYLEVRSVGWLQVLCCLRVGIWRMATSSLLAQSRYLEERSVGWSQVLCCLRAGIWR